MAHIPDEKDVGITPGPWEYWPAQNYDGFAIAPRGRLPTLAAIERKGCITAFNYPGQTEPNARLIATAPELLQALKDLLRDEKLDDGDERLGRSRARAANAIAKAEGRSRG